MLYIRTKWKYFLLFLLIILFSLSLTSRLLGTRCTQDCTKYYSNVNSYVGGNTLLRIYCSLFCRDGDTDLSNVDSDTKKENIISKKTVVLSDHLNGDDSRSLKDLKKFADEHLLVKYGSDDGSKDPAFDNRIDGGLKRFVNDTWLVKKKKIEEQKHVVEKPTITSLGTKQSTITTKTTEKPTITTKPAEKPTSETITTTTTTEKPTIAMTTTGKLTITSTTTEKVTITTKETEKPTSETTTEKPTITTTTAEKPTITTKETEKPTSETTTEKPTITTTTAEKPTITSMKTSTTTTENLTTKTPTEGMVSTTSLPQQDTRKCRIPQLDPFHREAQPYIKYNWLNERCQIKQEKSRVENGNLIVDITNVITITLHYILRVSDDVTRLDTQIIYNSITNSNRSVFTYRLQHDFIKVDIKEEKGGRHKEYSEYHMYPVKKPPHQNQPPFKKLNEEKDKYNVLLVMLDSVSNACAQRYLKKTYRFLEENPYTVIMKGHTIVGDATTPQLSALFFGDQPNKLRPEGRRGFPKSQQIDDWPSLFKDYQKKGYVTLHSEDQPSIGAFNYRLRGFKNQPTFKYLRAFWSNTQDLRKLKLSYSSSCPLTFALDYLNNFYKEYSDELSLSILLNSALTHNRPKLVQMFDDGFVDMFRTLNKTKRLESTVVVFFGDHGMREGGFRQTTQGKLEERLPLMTITLPPSFYDKYPEKVKHLKENSEVLTTPYDMHATLKHLLSVREDPPEHPYGKSLFTNISKLNRDCLDAGIDAFWCVCSQFENIPSFSRDSVVSLISNVMVDSINQILKNTSPIVESSCQILTLKSILKASKMVNKKRAKSGFDTYEIVFETHPCGGRFETTGEYNRETKTVKIGSNVSRINKYGNQPKCVEQQYPHVRKFCCCK